MQGTREEEREVIPVVEEQVAITKQSRVTGVVRAHTRIREEERPVSAELHTEEITIERVPCDKFVEGPIPDRQEGDTTVISVLAEIPVVEKRLKLVEEVRITRRAVTRRMEDTVTVRRQDVEIERGGPEDADR